MQSILVAFFALPLAVACGGGGGGGSGSTGTGGGGGGGTPPPTNNAPTWTQNVFEAASQFKDRCEAPRSGTDIEGNTFPDVAGSTLLENFWLRSWTEETYLWNDEVVDRDPSTFNDRLSYFAVLKTDAVTASGEDKDDFHFSQSTEDFLEQRNSTPTASYGVSLVSFSSSPPRDFRVRYTDPNTPASEVVMGQVNLPRGTRILEVNGVDLVTSNNVDALNAGLFPANAGETNTFLVQDVGSNTPRTITMTSANLSQKPVNRTEILNTTNGKVGYILFNTFSPFSSEQEIANAMTEMQNEGVTDLVLDLRYNGGGLLAVASQLSYMIAGSAQTNNKTFEQLEFNTNAGNTNPVLGGFNGPIPFYDTGLGFTLANGTPLPSLNLSRIFILSTGSTCSASEAVINGLRGIDVEIVLIGNITCGKPYGFYPTDNCGETYYTIQFRGVNDKGFGDYSDGFVPNNSSFGFGERVSGCVVADDYLNELGDPNEGLLAAALAYRDTQTCPAVTPKPSEKKVLLSQSKGEVATTAVTPAKDLMQNNRDMRMPY